MIIKTIDIPFTGEPMVSLLEGKLTKTASNDIQQYWANLEKSPKYAYLHVLAMTDSNHYGPNNNGDWFNEEDLKKYHNTFCSDAHIYLHHVNKDPMKSVGRPVYSFYNDNMHRVELILAIDKANPMSADTVAKIRRGEQLFVSMGCKVPYDICSICGNRAKTRSDYCQHLKFDMKKIMEDGRQVYAINPPPLKFFDISLVTRPADRVAWALDKMAGESPQPVKEVVPEIDKTALLRHINKFSEILKTVDGEVLDYQDIDTQLADKLKFISSFPAAEMDLPEYQGAVPIGTLVRISISKGIPPTLHEIGRSMHVPEEHIPEMVHGMHGATELFRRDPMRLVNLLREIVGMDDNREHRDLEIVLTKRAGMFKTAQLPLYQGRVDDPLAKKWYEHFPYSQHVFSGLRNSDPGNATPIYAHGYKTNRYNAMAGETGIIPALASAAAMAAGIGIVLTGLTPQKLVAGAAMALLGLSTWPTGNKVQVDSPLKGEVPAGTYFNKSAASAATIGNISAVAIPTLLGLDYFINSRLRHKDNPYYREDMGRLSRMADKAGEVVFKHPLTTIGGSLVAKNLVHEAWKNRNKVQVPEEKTIGWFKKTLNRRSG